MLVGVYEFNTASRELIEIHSGNLNLQRTGSDSWQLITEGMDFNILKNFKRQHLSCSRMVVQPQS